MDVRDNEPPGVPALSWAFTTIHHGLFCVGSASPPVGYRHGKADRGPAARRGSREPSQAERSLSRARRRRGRLGPVDDRHQSGRSGAGRLTNHVSCWVRPVQEAVSPKHGDTWVAAIWPRVGQEASATQTARSSTATAVGRNPRRCVPTSLVWGSIVETVPSSLLVTHTRSAPNAIPLGPLPTLMGGVRTLEVSASIRITASPVVLVTQTAPSP